MNAVIVASGADPGALASCGGTGSVLCVAVFAAAGLVLLLAGACLLRRCREPHACRYSAPRR